MLDKMLGQVEAILFASGEPIEASRIAEAIGTEVSAVQHLVSDLAAKLEEQGSALEVLRLEDKYQLATRMEYADVIKSALEMRRNTPLSQAAMEVLAIISYNQPVTRAFIEQVRGVDSSGVVSSLVEKELVEEVGRLNLPGRPLAYGTTANFLRCFGLESLEELPQVAASDDEGAIPEDLLEGQLGFDDELEELRETVEV